MIEDEDPHQNPYGSNRCIQTRVKPARTVSLLEHKEKGVCLGKDYQFKTQDVICGVGRGKQQEEAIRHPGNERLRILADLSVGRYRKATERREKFNIVKEIVEAVRASGGKFVRQHDGMWYEVGFVAAREKAGYALRNALGKAKKPLVAAKKQRMSSSPSEMRKKRVSFDLSSQRSRQVSIASSEAQMDHHFSPVESIDPDPICHGRGKRPEPEGFREFVRSTFLPGASTDQQGLADRSEPRNAETGYVRLSRDKGEDDGKQLAAPSSTNVGHSSKSLAAPSQRSVEVIETLEPPLASVVEDALCQDIICEEDDDDDSLAAIERLID